MKDGRYFEDLLRQFIDIVYFKNTLILGHPSLRSPQSVIPAVLHCNNPYLSLPFKMVF